MNNWKTSLDRYLTEEPSCDFDNWCELVVENFTEDFFNKNEEWILENNGISEKWFTKLFSYKPEKAAKIIEKGFKL